MPRVKKADKEKSVKIKNPVKFLTSQIELDLDAVKLVRKTREEFV